MGLKQIAAPAVEPVTLNDMKLQLGYGPMEFADALQEQLLAEEIRPAIVAARQQCEAICGRAFITQQWQMTLDRFPHWHEQYQIEHRFDIRIPLPTFQTLDAFTYIDTGGNTNDITAPGGWGYQLVAGGDTRPAKLRPPIGMFWPPTFIDQANAVAITFTCGFGDTPATVPYAVRAAVKLYAEWIYNGSKGKQPEAVNALLGPYIIETT